MIRSELVQKLCGDFPDLTQREVEGVVGALFDSITDQLAKGGAEAPAEPKAEAKPKMPKAAKAAKADKAEVEAAPAEAEAAEADVAETAEVATSDADKE